jgi:manganese/zinc/iron transport system substrate-binding protein
MRRVRFGMMNRLSHRLSAAVSLLLGLALLLTTVGCVEGEASGSQAGKPRVVATTTIVGDLVRDIAGDRVDLRVLMPPGVDPHGYTVTTADLGAISAATLVFYNGLHLEGTMVELLEGELSGRAVAVTRDVPAEQLLAWTEGGKTHDPHVWHDASLWAHAAGTVGEALARVDPPHAEHYRAAATALADRYRGLHDDIRATLAAVPQRQRLLITSHDAYSYFGRAYGLEVRGVQGISTETEAGLGSVNALVDLIVERSLPAVFVESSVNPRTIQRVQADAASRGVSVRIGGELYSDALGSPDEHPGRNVHTYEGMMRYNAATIAEALGPK